MNSLALIMQAAFLFAACVCILSAVGLGVGLYALPGLDGEELLLLPAIGLGTAALTMTWLTPLVPAVGSTAILLLWTIPVASVMSYRRRHYLIHALHCKWKLFGFAIALAFAVYLVLLIPTFSSGFFTVASPGTDGVYIYAPVTHYLQTHPYPQPDSSTAINPSLVYLRSYYPSEPSALLVPAMAASITGWPAYSIIDTFNALCISLGVFGLIVVLRPVLNVPRVVAVSAVGAYSTNQYLVWNMGFDFLPQSQSVMLFMTILALCAISMRTLSRRSVALLGVCAAALAGIYFPVVVACAICCSALAAT
ncbi:MAG TPA: hypothetical protein VKX46_16105, partial [Ktedonobacteraceae bacterium]|nr:hypothetical protein [Ktedonobacteraceae bacterium]